MMRRRRREALPQTVAERVKQHIESEQAAERLYNEKHRTDNELTARIASLRVHVQTAQPLLDLSSFDNLCPGWHAPQQAARVL